VDNVPESKPNPDPSILTTESLQREVRSLEDADKRITDDMQREFAIRQDNRQRELQSLKELTESEQGSIRESIHRLEALVNANPGLITKEVEHLQELMNEKLRSIDLRFVERDVRTQQAAETSQKALDAALLAAAALVNQQNEANASAAALQSQQFTKQIDQIIVLTERSQKAFDDRLGELKERIDRGDGTTSGIKENRIEQRAVSMQTIATIALFATVLGALLAKALGF
jgi:predicted component of type VI protein secretion system